MSIRKLLLIVALVESLVCPSFAIDLSLINLGNVPGISDMWNDLLFTINHENLLQSYIPDDYWNHPISKRELAERLETLAMKLDSIEENGKNQELLLLKGLICYYLFNLDQQEYYEKAINNLTRIDAFLNRDYRYKWFLGLVYTTSIKPFEAIEQFEYVESRIHEKKLHPLFWKDYAYASFLAFMPIRAVNNFEKFSKYANTDLEKINLYRSLKDSLVAPTVDMEIPKEDLFQIFERRTGFGFLSRPLGIWIPAKREWTPRYSDYKNQFSGLVFESQNLKDENVKNITFSIGAFFYVNKDNVVSQYMTFAPQVEQVDNLDIDKKYTVFEIKNPDQYKHIGGAHGYIVIYESEQSVNSGYSIERPSKISVKVDGATKYLPMQKHYLRFPGKITYVFLLDSCENIFAISRNEFISFLKNVLIQ